MTDNITLRDIIYLPDEVYDANDNEARGYGAKIDQRYQKGYSSKDDLQEINFINNLSNNDYGLGLIGEWWNAVGIVTGKQIGRASCRERVSSPV